MRQVADSIEVKAFAAIASIVGAARSRFAAQRSSSLEVGAPADQLGQHSFERTNYFSKTQPYTLCEDRWDQPSLSVALQPFHSHGGVPCSVAGHAPEWCCRHTCGTSAPGIPPEALSRSHVHSCAMTRIW